MPAVGIINHCALLLPRPHYPIATRSALRARDSGSQPLSSVINAGRQMSRRKNRYRTIWISDLHLGTRNTRSTELLDFLECNDADYLYLVGDIIDGWALRRNWYWPQVHNDVIQLLLHKARKGTRVVYIPGNHDEFARDFLNVRFGGITVKDEAIHTALDSRQFLVIHGDQFDGIIKHARWLSTLGASFYYLLLKLNRWLNFARRRMGLPYWSLSAYLKNKTKRAVQFMADFENAVAREARAYGVEGVVCGHIHRAEMRTIDGIEYCNTGDWVESGTALVEHVDGQINLINWLDQSSRNNTEEPVNEEELEHLPPPHLATLLQEQEIAIKIA